MLRWNRRDFLKVGFTGVGGALVVESIPLAKWVPPSLPDLRTNIELPIWLYRLKARSVTTPYAAQILEITRVKNPDPILKVIVPPFTEFQWVSQPGYEISCFGGLVNNSMDLKVELSLRQGDRSWTVGDRVVGHTM